MSLRDEIIALPEATLRARNDAAIAAALSVGRTKIVSTLIGFGTVLDALGPEAGAALLDRLEALGQSVSAVKWAMRLLDGSKLDIGLPSVRGQIDSLVADGVMSAEQGETLKALKALAVVADPVAVGDVSAILNAEGY